MPEDKDHKHNEQYGVAQAKTRRTLSPKIAAFTINTKPQQLNFNMHTTFLLTIAACFAAVLATPAHIPGDHGSHTHAAEAANVKRDDLPPCLDKNGKIIPPRTNCPPMVDLNHSNKCQVCK